MIIESNDNSKLKLVRKLSTKKARHKEGLYIVEGIKILNHAINLGAKIEFILFSTRIFEVSGGREMVKRIYKESLEYSQVDEIIFDKLADTVTNQGVIAVVNIRSLSDKNDISKFRNRCIFIDSVQDPGNLGTIIRTADAAGFNEIFISKGTVDPYNQKVVRAAMGSILNTNIYFIDENVTFLKKLKENNYQIIATEADSSDSYNDVSYNEKIVLIVGNEGNGINNEVLNEANYSVNIPIEGTAESLNAGVATGIMMYKIKEVIESK
jgi:TrmH family RNA methyltransferase